jgi:hypothetical protein
MHDSSSQLQVKVTLYTLLSDCFSDALAVTALKLPR